MLSLLAPSVISQTTVTINMTESGKIVDYFGQYFIVSVSGVISVNNPTTVRIFDLNLPYDLAGMTIIDSQNTGYLYPDRLQIPTINPQSIISIPYSVIGITALDPIPTNNTVLWNSMEFSQFRANSILQARLYKGELNESRRLVSVHLENPTSFLYNITQLEVIKTTTLNPNVQISHWDFTTLDNETFLQPHSLITHDIYDTNSTDQDVYWLATDIILSDFDIFSFADLTRNQEFSEEGLFQDPDVVVERQIEEFIEQTDVDLIVRKVISGKVVNPGDRLNVTLIIDNLGKGTKTTDITDTLPAGFKLISQTDDPIISEQGLLWKNILVNGQSSKHIKYTLEYLDTESVGIDFFNGATVSYENRTVFSPRVPFVRRYQPKQSLFIQKRLRYLGNNVVEVTITLQNLGEAELRNLILQEFLQEADDFREITQIPQEKGQWLIALIPRDQSWTVTYLTDENERLNTLPEIYGVDRAAVSKSIVLVHTIESTFTLSPIQWIEVIGVSMLVLLVVGYLMLWKFFPNTQQNILLGARKAGGKLHIIKEPMQQKPAPEKEVLPTMAGSADFSKAAPLRESERLAKQNEPPPR